jgi:hypothetical protein
MPIDCNTLIDLSHAFLEFASAAAAIDAMSALQGKQFLQDKHVVVDPVTLDPEILITMYKTKPTRFFLDFERDYDLEDVLNPVKEGRKISVGGFSATIKVDNGTFRNMVKEAFRAYAVETMSKAMARHKVKYVLLEMATKEGADRIKNKMRGAELLGTKVTLERVVLEEAIALHSTQFLGLEENPQKTRF